MTVLFLTLVFTNACSVETTGMQAPLAHDYDGLEWVPLTEPVTQPVLVAPGYTAAIENDPQTSSDELERRLLELPADVRQARLTEIQIRLRPPAPDVSSPTPTVQLFVLPDADTTRSSFEPLSAPALEVEATTHLRGDDLIVISSPPAINVGEVFVIRLIPGQSGEPAWEYAITPERRPYGGWFAEGTPGAAQSSLAYTTVFERDVRWTAIVSPGWAQIRALPSRDPFFVVVYLGTTLVMLTATTALLMRRPRKV